MTQTHPARERIEATIHRFLPNYDAQGVIALTDAMVKLLPAVDGWKLVPVEPTPKMIAATFNHPVDRYAQTESQNTRNRRIWSAMLAASPDALRPSAPASVAGSEDELDPVATEAHSRGMDEGATFVLEDLARQLAVTDYQQADGSEEWEGDVSGTVHNILVTARVLDDYDGSIARHQKGFVTCPSCNAEFDQGEWEASRRCPECEEPKALAAPASDGLRSALTGLTDIQRKAIRGSIFLAGNWVLTTQYEDDIDIVEHLSEDIADPVSGILTPFGNLVRQSLAALDQPQSGEEKPLCTYPRCGAGHPLACKCRSGSDQSQSAEGLGDA